MIPVQQQTFTVPAGGSFPLQCNGRYFRIQSASGALKVVADTFGTMGLVGVGQGIRLRDHDPAFQRLTFIDTSGAPNIVTVVVADADFVDNSLLGTVSVVDGGKARTLAGGAFLGYGYQPSGGAATFAGAQLVNTSTTKNVYVSQILLGTSGTGAGGLVVNVGGGNLTNVVGFAANKNVGGVASAVSQLRKQTNAGLIGNTVMTAAKGQQVIFKEPLLLTPNQQVAVWNATANEDVFGAFEFIEELI